MPFTARPATEFHLNPYRFSDTIFRLQDSYVLSCGYT